MKASGRVTALVLLAAFVFWASGGAWAAHMAIEHGVSITGKTCAGCERCAAGSDMLARMRVAFGSQGKKSPAPAKSEHGCATCQMLATMTVEGAGVATVAPSLERLPQVVEVGEARVGFAGMLGMLPPANGPPLG